MLLIRGLPAADGDAEDVEAVTIRTDEIEAVHTDDGITQRSTVATDLRQIVLTNDAPRDFIVGQFELPVGTLEQVRIFPHSVEIQRKGGDVQTLGHSSSLIA